MPKLTRLKKRTANDILIPYFCQRARLTPKLSPSEWCEQNINFSYCKSPPVDKLDINLTPYIREPLDNFTFQGALQMTLCFPPQSGKSLVWMGGILYVQANDPGPGIIVYSNDEMASDMSTDRVIPLLRSVPQFEQELKSPFAIRKDCYQLSESNTWFTGAGSAASLASRSARYVIADETDKWLPIPNEADPLDLLRHRTKTYSKNKLFVVVCTPTGKNGVVWVEYLKGSMAEWYWHCLKCGHGQRPNTQYFKFDRDEAGEVIEDSPRFVCGECGHKHKEADRRATNLKGHWQHKYKSRMNHHRRYHITALASPFETWMNIARKIVEASAAKGDPQKQRDVDNSILAIPFSPRRNVEKGLLATLNMHKTDYTLVDIEGRMRGMFMAVDTQDRGYYWLIRAVMDNTDKFLIDYGFVEDDEALEIEWNKERYGRLPLLGIKDQGGHRTKDVTQWVKAHKYWWKYKGENRISSRWKMSPNDPLLISAQSKVFQAELLYYIYTAIERDVDGYWFLPSDLDGRYEKQIVTMSPDIHKQGGNEYEEWVSHGKDDHYFDCEKMWLVIYDYALKMMQEKDWYQPLRPVEGTQKKIVVPPRRVAKAKVIDEYQP